MDPRYTVQVEQIFSKNFNEFMPDIVSYFQANLNNLEEPEAIGEETPALENDYLQAQSFNDVFNFWQGDDIVSTQNVGNVDLQHTLEVSIF